LVHGAAWDLEGLPGGEGALGAVETGAQCPGEDLERLVLAGMEMLGRRRAVRLPAALDDELFRGPLADPNRFVGSEMQGRRSSLRPPLDIA
jgi:hypothetical protein